MVVGPDGAMWFTELFGDKIGRITTGGTLTEYPIDGGWISPGTSPGSGHSPARSSRYSSRPAPASTSG